MNKKFLQLSFLQLAAISLALIVGISTGLAGANCVREKIYRKNGQLVETEVQISDLDIESIKQTEDGKYVATDGDPQIYIKVQGLFTGIRFEMKSSMPPGRLICYYTTGRDMPFSEKNILLPTRDENGIYIINVPQMYVHTLRIDPTEFAGNYMTFGNIVINGEKNITITPTNLLYTAVYTAVLTAILKLLQKILQKNNINYTKK